MAKLKDGKRNAMLFPFFNLRSKENESSEARFNFFGPSGFQGY
jgi:hypothetical protein